MAYRYGYVQIRNDNTIAVTGEKLSWNEYMDISRRLYSLVKDRDITNIELDLSKLIFIYPDGMVPLICNIDYWFEKRNIQIHVILPKDDEACKYASRMGWISSLYMYGNDSETDPFITESAILRFSNDDELNISVNKVLESCSRQMRFADGAFEAFEWSLNEIAGNILVHARTKHGWIQVVPNKRRGRIDILVCDHGYGIPRNIKKRFPDISDDCNALQEAIKKGITSNPKDGQGNGLAGAISIAQANRAHFKIASGSGEIYIDNGIVKAKKYSLLYMELLLICILVRKCQLI